MNALRTFSAIALAILSFAAPAHAGSRWVLRAGAGESVSGGHGSALEAALSAEVKPDLWLGMETGLCRMAVQSAPSYASTDAAGAGLGGAIGGYTDGITRNREFFLGPQVRWGSAMYVVASYGLADVRGTAAPDTYLQGGSVGVGIGGSGRFEPSGELRLRWVSDVPPGQQPGLSGNAITFTVGVHVR